MENTPKTLLFGLRNPRLGGGAGLCQPPGAKHFRHAAHAHAPVPYQRGKRGGIPIQTVTFTPSARRGWKPPGPWPSAWATIPWAASTCSWACCKTAKAAPGWLLAAQGLTRQGLLEQLTEAWGTGALCRGAAPSPPSWSGRWRPPLVAPAAWVTAK